MESMERAALAVALRDETPCHVLLVDADEGIRSFLKVALLLNLDGTIGEIVDAADGEEAVELCYRLQPAVVVMNSSIPRMNGGTAAWLFRDMVPTVRIIAYSDEAGGKPDWADDFVPRAELYGITPLTDLIGRRDRHTEEAR